MQKKFIVSLSLVLLFAFANTAFSLPVQLISSSYKLSGGYFIDIENPTGYEEIFIRQSNQPCYESFPLPEDLPVDGYLTSETGQFFIDVHTVVIGMSSFGWAGANAEWIFRPRISGNLTISYFEIGGYVGGILSLYDLTDEMSLWSESHLMDSASMTDIYNGYTENVWSEGLEDLCLVTHTINHELQTDHSYKLIFAAGTNSDQDMQDLSIYASLNAVPEPATMLLLGLGLIGLAGVRREPKK